LDTLDRFFLAMLAVYTRMNLPTKMRALQQTSLKGPKYLQLIREEPVPVPGVGELLIRVTVAGVNFVDISRSHGTFGNNPTAPFIAGFEAVGEVVAHGEAVSQPAIGTHVICAGPGAYAEYMTSSARAAMPVPTGWTDEQALGLVVNWPTALAALRLGRVASGETVVIHAAAGATGRAALVLAKHFGARVIAVAASAKHAALRAADHVLDSSDPALGSAINELTSGRGADLVIESAGGSTFQASLAATKRITGRVVVLGLAGGEASVSNWDLVYTHQVQLIGFNLGALIQAAPEVFGQIMGELGALMAAGIVTPTRATTYPLAEGARALAELENRTTTGKLALIP
jgi:NADPH2:quinone reductase